MSFAAAALALLVGATLGLFGGGGAVLTLPVFVYVLGVPVKSAVPMSLFVIGTASIVGAAERWRRTRFDPRRAAWLGAAAMVGAFFGAQIGIALPVRAQMSIFAVVVIVAASRMLYRATKENHTPHSLPWGLDYVVFALIGVLTSVIGVGGGFLFVPALVTVLGIPMAEATGISMMVIAMNSAAALLGYQGHVDIQWGLVLSFTAVVIVATLIAGRIATRIRVPTLMRGFAVMLIGVGALVLFENLR
ncbi:MAG TPA: sulfite exporter TauE/SafE family protein [Gemmatimonadaceae bacterium]|nr:sulfite exporter TauE/SafE family protein [Gemmatimonadaceae bacterium]